MNREVRKMWHKKEERTQEVHREYLKKTGKGKNSGRCKSIT